MEISAEFEKYCQNITASKNVPISEHPSITQRQIDFENSLREISDDIDNKFADRVQKITDEEQLKGNDISTLKPDLIAIGKKYLREFKETEKNNSKLFSETS